VGVLMANENEKKASAMTNAEAVAAAKRECPPLTRGRDLGFELRCDAEEECGRLAALALTLAERLEIEMLRSAKMSAIANDAAGSRDAQRDRADRMELALVVLLRRHGGAVAVSVSDIRDAGLDPSEVLIHEPPGAPLARMPYIVALSSWDRTPPLDLRALTLRSAAEKIRTSDLPFDTSDARDWLLAEADAVERNGDPYADLDDPDAVRAASLDAWARTSNSHAVYLAKLRSEAKTSRDAGRVEMARDAAALASGWKARTKDGERVALGIADGIRKLVTA